MSRRNGMAMNGRRGGIVDSDLMTVDAGAGEPERGGSLTLDALRERIAKGEIETVVCAMPDLWGRLVGKRVTGKTFLSTVIGDEGLHGSLYLFVVDMDMDPRPGYALTSWENGFLDCRMVPDLSTLRAMPWLEKTALVICDPHHEDSGEPVAVAPRVMLRRQLDRLRDIGMTLKCATELEFFIFRETYEDAWDKRYRDLRPMSYYRSDYHILQSTKDDWFLRRVRAFMEQAGLDVEFSKSEWGLGQQEVNLRYCDALEMADRHLLYKNGVKEIAALAGLSASFMAKPAIDEIGSSCHVHCSLWDAAGERPLMWDENAPGHVSRTFSRFIAGQVEHGRDLAVLFAPNVNSYKRFQAQNFAGVSLAWGFDNRTCGLRVVGERESLRLEHRIPGADVNPYLTLAALAAAGLDGIERGSTPPPAFSGNAYGAASVPVIPGSLGEAIALFDGSALARSAFGEEAFTHLSNFFRQELHAFQHETVTDWELVRYFERV
jgi:glutamine synthetase